MDSRSNVMHAACLNARTSCRVLALADGVHLEADVFVHGVNENATILKTAVGAVHDAMATVELHGVMRPTQALLGELIPRIGVQQWACINTAGPR